MFDSEAVGLGAWVHRQPEPCLRQPLYHVQKPETSALALDEKTVL